MEFFQTRDRERAIRALARRYERVFVRNKNVAWHPLRFRRSAIADLSPFLVMSPREFDAQLDGWNRSGGVCVHERNYVPWEDVGAHQAQVISECPMSRDLLEQYVEGARELAVIFYPPNWDEHRRWVAANFPPGDLCERFHAAVLAAPRDEAMGELLGLRPGFHVMRELEARQAIDSPAPVMRLVRRRVFRPRNLKPIWRATLRAEPEDRTLAEIYRYIGDVCPQVGGVHYVRGYTLMKKTRFWKRAMRQLERCGAIGAKGLVTCYWPDELPPNFVRMDARRRRAERQLDEMIEYVGALPEFNQPAKRSPRSPVRLASPQSASA